ncbi:unnamed protein product [Rotaria sordida]|uniref:Mutator-like transposase domain-containing protein n=1 Tax=Rotaria sordida TaxID=392033 RepID=A0A819Q1T5_9BILA|nr:unnamed protein product [Rotaria sordida]
MPTTKGRNTHQRSKAAICRKARSRKREQFRRSASARSSSLSSSELSSKLEETFISSLYSTTDSSFSNNILHQSFTSQQKLLSYEKRKNHAIADCDDMNFYQVIHNTFLLELLKNTICIQCREPWDGKMYIRGHLAGIGRAGIVKAFGAMNVAPPVHEEYYEEIDKTLLLPCIKELQNQSMQAAIYEAVDENDGDPTALTVSGDGTWQKRGFKSIHGIAAILSASRTRKVLDVERLSKKCLVCTGALSIKKQNPDLYHEIIHNHDCESNYDGSSGGMESQGIQNLFQRSFSKYNVQYTRYVKIFTSINDSDYELISSDDEIYLNQLIEPVVNVHPPEDQINNDNIAQDVIRDLDDDANVELQIEEPTIDAIMNDDDDQMNSVNNHSVVVGGMNNPTEHHHQRIKKKRSLQAKQKKNRKRNNQLRLLRYKYYLTRSYYYRFKSRTVKKVLRYYGVQFRHIKFSYDQVVIGVKREIIGDLEGDH